MNIKVKLQNSAGAVRVLDGFRNGTQAKKHVMQNYDGGWAVSIYDEDSADYQNSGDLLNSFFTK
jgi:hypothetical protein